LRPPKTLLALIALAFAYPSATGIGSAQTPATDPVPRMQQLIQSYAKSKIPVDQFMGSVLVAQGDKVLIDQGYGSANLDWGIPNAPDTRFRLGSLTKQFTAASILLLEQRGKLSTSDLVKKYVPEAPPSWDRMTLYEVLTHTAGIPDFTSFPDYRTTEWKPAAPAELVARFIRRPLEFEPGTQYRYSNSGYVLLGYILEKVAGITYAEFLQQNLFTPLGLADTGVDRSQMVMPHRAQGYDAHPQGPTIARYVDMTVPFSAGDLYSTTQDLWKWEKALFGGKVLSPASLAKMTTPNQNTYALGIEVQQIAGHKVYVHGGAIEGFKTSLAYFPDEKNGPVTIVVLSNLGAAVEKMTDGLAAILFGIPVEFAPKTAAAPTEVTLPAKLLQDYVGAYRFSPALTIVITLSGNQLISQTNGQSKVPLYAESETRFFTGISEGEFEFNRDAAGKVISMTLYRNGTGTVGAKD
jgi:CubicO group peptidase (beta-lactamase class C family)